MTAVYPLRFCCGLIAIVSVVVSSVSSQDPPTCTEQQGPCACKTSDGKWINLEALDSKDSSNPMFKDVQDYNGDKYSYNPCSDFSYGGCSGVAACQSRDPLGYSLGNQASATFGSDPTYGDLTVTYKATGDDGMDRQAVVTLKCDQSQEGDLQANGEYPTGVYDLTLTSKYACPVPVVSTPCLEDGVCILVISLVSVVALILVACVCGLLCKKVCKHGQEKVAINSPVFNQSGVWGTNVHANEPLGYSAPAYEKF